jgi:hypothetical protein
VGLLCFHEPQSLFQGKLLPSEFIQLSLIKKNINQSCSAKNKTHQSSSAYKTKQSIKLSLKNITITLSLQKQTINCDQPTQKQNSLSAQTTKTINQAQKYNQIQSINPAFRNGLQPTEP